MLETYFEPNLVRDKSNMTDVEQNIPLSAVIVCTENNLSCDLKGEAVILNLESGIYFGMNPLGARIWELIQHPVKVSDVQRQLLREYDIQPVDCQKDLMKFLETLLVQKLIKVCTD